MSYVSTPPFLLVTTSGPEVGYGHLARTTALAEHLRRNGVAIEFVADPSASAWLRRRGLPARFWSAAAGGDPERLLGGDPDCLVIDLPARAGYWDEVRRAWLDGARRLGIFSLAFEDRPGAWPAAAGLVVNPNAGSYTPAGAADRYLAGTDFQPVRREFINSKQPRVRDSVERVLVCLGGGTAPQVVGVVEQLKRSWPRAGLQVFAAAGDLPGGVEAVGDFELLPERAGQADVAVIGGGQLKAEMACLGVPAVVLPVAGDQRPSCLAWEHAGGCVAWSTADLEVILDRAADPAWRRRLSSVGRRLVDGRGAARIAERLRQLLDGRGGRR